MTKNRGSGCRREARDNRIKSHKCPSQFLPDPKIMQKGVIQNRVTLRQREATEYRISLKLCLTYRHIVTLQRGHQPTRLPSHSS